jgi:multidrug resistance protein MdtO
LQGALHDLTGEAASKEGVATPDHPGHPQEPARATVASTRPHARFAVKVMCAVLASYAMYTLLDWPGIRTAVTTCFFVSLTTVGESVHKLTLRLTGAIVGGLIAGLSIVFVLPSLTDIGQLCLLVAVVSTFCAWISTSSETIAYAGMQVAFAFFLGVLQGYGPAADLTVLRDRLVGIIAGNVWVTIFFTVLWPVSVWDQVRAKQAAVLDKLADLLVTVDHRAAMGTQVQALGMMSEASGLRARALFEWRFLPELKQSAATHADAFDLEEIASAVLVVRRLRATMEPPGEDPGADQLAAARLKALSKGPRHAVPDGHPDATSSGLLGDARRRLDEVIDHASRTI